MKRIITLTLALALATAATFAQKYNAMQATVSRTEHKAAVAKSNKATGKFYFKRPDRLCLTFDGGKDALLMNGSTYTLVRKGRRSVARGEMQRAFEPLQEVLKTVCSGADTKTLKGKSGIVLATQGGTTTITITPATADAKAARRLLFKQFVVTLDAHSGEVRALRMVGRGKNNYTDYTFAQPAYNVTLADALFK